MTLSKKEMYSYNKFTDEKEYCYKSEDVQKSIRKIKDKIVSNDIYTADEIFRIINEEMGDKLI